jgi:chromosome partitioning protein
MTTVAFVNGKGGTGKTTLCMAVAMALTAAGRRVAVADRDPQGTTIGWLQRIGVEGQGPFPYDPKGVFDAVLIDTPPRLNEPAVREAIAQADRIVIVSTPSPVDLETTARTVRDFVLPLRHERGDPRVAMVFNQVQPGTLLSRSLADQAAKIPGVKALQFFVRRRQCFQHSSLLGWAALTDRAQEEISQLTQEIFNF